jgi:hypothetical protein
MSNIHKLAILWRSKILRLAKDGEDFTDLLKEFDDGFDPDSTPPNSIPVSRIPQSGRENISGKSISNPKKVNNMLLNQMSKNFESFASPLENKINQINSLFSRVNQQKTLLFSTKSNIISDLLAETKSIIQSAVVDFISEGEKSTVLQRIELGVQKLEEVIAEFEILSAVFLREKLLNSENLQKQILHFSTSLQKAKNNIVVMRDYIKNLGEE